MKKIGFTLVELSISLVIIGFILSSMYAANNMYKASKLRQINKEFLLYQSAINTFKNIYNAIPGDMLNAAIVLPSVIGSGNGNGLVDTNSEIYYMPQHLQAADLINGYYNGTSSLIASKNSPNAWLYKSFNQVIYNLFIANQANFLYYTKNIGGSNGSINSVDAYTFDRKFDDANASTGNVLAMVTNSSISCIKSVNGTGTNQDSTYTGEDANYNLTSSPGQCEIIFQNSLSNYN